MHNFQKIWKLNRAIYGLKQAARAWWLELEKSLKELGFNKIYADAGIFVSRDKKGTFVIMLAYVDDIIVTGPNTAYVISKKQMFMQKWECRDLGSCKEFLRMTIEYENGDIKISQSKYLQRVLERFDMQDSRYAQTPLPTGYKPSKYLGPCTPELRSKYQQAIGSLLYLMIGTRPDICFAVSLMAKFSNNPSEDHFNRVKYIMRYLNGTKNYCLRYQGKSNLGIYAYCDASWGDDKREDPPVKYVEGWFFSLAGAAIKWTSKTLPGV